MPRSTVNAPHRTRHSATDLAYRLGTNLAMLPVMPGPAQSSAGAVARLAAGGPAGDGSRCRNSARTIA
jgi:hypothetical protein